MKSGIAHPVALMPWITVAHSLLPDWITLGNPHLSEVVTTDPTVMWPIMKPVSSKLHVSSSSMPYLAFMLNYMLKNYVFLSLS